MSHVPAKIVMPKNKQPLFIDTSIFIYLFEDHTRFGPILGNLFEDLSKGKFSGITSVITVSEVLTKPYQNHDHDLIIQYQDIFTHLPHLKVASFSFEAAVRAAQIRARYEFKMLDSIQLAIAYFEGCKSFLTNDKELTKFKNLSILYLENLIK